MKVFKFVWVPVLLLGFTVTAFTQKLSIAHVDTQKIIEAMPESDTARKKLQNTTKQLQDEMEAMQVELNRKYEEYVNNRDQYSSRLVRQTKEAELQEMQQRIQTFQMQAEQDLQETQDMLFQPIYNKVNQAIQKVAEENGYTYVLDVSMGSVVYFSEQSNDIKDLVLQELGL